MKEYDHLSRKNELIELISESEATIEQRKLKAKEIVEGVLADSVNIKNNLTALLDEWENYTKIIDLKTPNLFSMSILSLLEKVSIFKIKRDNRDVEEIQGVNQPPLQDQLEGIMHLAKIPFNFLTEEYYRFFENELKKYSSIFSSISLPEMNTIQPLPVVSHLTI
jgi:hypothetical protein